MCSRKSLVILLLPLAVSVVEGASSKLCKSQAGDILLHTEYVKKSFSLLQYVSATVNINVGNNIINCVHAIDKWNDGTGGYAKFVGGGIGYNYVDVYIKSQFGRGFSFEIEVYGQKPQKRKYLRKVCLKFRTCPPTHHNCGYTTFYPKVLSA